MLKIYSEGGRICRSGRETASAYGGRGSPRVPQGTFSIGISPYWDGEHASLWARRCRRPSVASAWNDEPAHRRRVCDPIARLGTSSSDSDGYRRARRRLDQGRGVIGEVQRCPESSGADVRYRRTRLVYISLSTGSLRASGRSMSYSKPDHRDSRSRSPLFQSLQYMDPRVTIKRHWR